MYWTNRTFGANTPWLAGLFLLAAAFESAAASSADTTEIIGLLNGTSLTANVTGVDPVNGLQYRRSADQVVTNLMPAQISRIRLVHAEPAATFSTCHVVLAPGEELEGTLLSMDADSVQLETPYAGRLNIPRRYVRSLDFMSADYAVKYTGPTNNSDWEPIPGGARGGFQLVQIFVGVPNPNPNPAVLGEAGNILNVVTRNSGNVQLIQTNEQNNLNKGTNAPQAEYVNIGPATQLNAQNQVAPVNTIGQFQIFVADAPQNRGAMVFQQRGVASVWVVRDGSLVGTGPGFIGRECELDRCSSIFEFDLKYSGPFSLLLSLYCPAANRSDFNAPSWVWSVPASSPAASDKALVLELADDHTDLVQAGAAYVDDPQGVNFSRISITNFPQKSNSAHIAIDCNRSTGSLTLLVNGVAVQKWTSITGFENMGNCIVIGNAGIGAEVTLSHLLLSRREDDFDPSRHSGDGFDHVSFVNRDAIRCKVTGMAGGKLNLTADDHDLHVPGDRLRHIVLAGTNDVLEPSSPWTVRAVFSQNASVLFQLEQWDDKTISGHSAALGPVSFPVGMIRELQFHPVQTRADAGFQHASEGGSVGTSLPRNNEIPAGK